MCLGKMFLITITFLLSFEILLLFRSQAQAGHWELLDASLFQGIGKTLVAVTVLLIFVAVYTFIVLKKGKDDETDGARRRPG